MILKFFRELPIWVDLGTRDSAEKDLANLAGRYRPDQVSDLAARLADCNYTDADRARRRSLTLGKQDVDGMSPQKLPGVLVTAHSRVLSGGRLPARGTSRPCCRRVEPMRPLVAAVAAVATVAADPAGRANSAVTEQERRPSGPTRLPRRTRPAITAIAPQQPTRPAGLPGPRRPIGPLADQRSPQQQLGGEVDHPHHVLGNGLQRLREGLQRHNIGRLGGGIRAPHAGQNVYELGMKRLRLRAQRLILLGVAREERRNRGRHLVLGSGQH